MKKKIVQAVILLAAIGTICLQAVTAPAQYAEFVKTEKNTERNTARGDTETQEILLTVKPADIAAVSAESPQEDVFIPLDINVDESLQKMVYDTSKKYGLDWTLIMAMIRKESNFTPSVISKTDDYGLMQINKIAHRYLSNAVGVTDFLDAGQNVEAGCFLISSYLQEYGSPEKALMAYNMGEGGAGKAWEKGITSTDYSGQILKYQREYEAIDQNR